MQTGACDAAITPLQPDSSVEEVAKSLTTARQVLLVLLEPVDHVEADLRRAVEESAGRVTVVGVEMEQLGTSEPWRRPKVADVYSKKGAKGLISTKRPSTMAAHCPQSAWKD